MQDNREGCKIAVGGSVGMGNYLGAGEVAYHFVLEVIDPETGCVESGVHITTTDIHAMAMLLGGELGDFDRRKSYDIDSAMVGKLVERFGINFQRHAAMARLRPWSRLDALPYRTHTNRELKLMLAGKKPLAYFRSDHLAGCDDIPETKFEPFVLTGRFVKREFTTVDIRPSVAGAERYESANRTRVVLYALPHEEWRIDAFILLKATGTKVGWSECLERIEGTLLGYEEWQNDLFIKLIYT